MQVDASSTFARQVLPTLLALNPPDGPSRDVLDGLGRWDGAMRIEDPEPLLFNEWMRRFCARDARRGRGRRRARGSGHRRDRQRPEPFRLGAVRGQLRPNPPLDTRRDSGSSGRLAASTLGRRARGGLRAPAARPHAGHRQIRHLAHRPARRRRHGLSRQPARTYMGVGPRTGYRGVYDLADLDASLFGLAPGQSGNPLSANASSLMRRWRDGEPVRLGPVPARIADTIGLEP